MTDREIIEERFSFFGGESMFDFYNSGKKLTPAQKLRDKELSCLSMINSILAYHWSNGKGCPSLWIQDENFKWTYVKTYYECTPENVLEFDQYCGLYLKEYICDLGEQRVKELIQEQLNTLSA